MPISGRERIAWDQRAESDADIAGLTFLMYVDDQQRELTEIACGALNGQLASCTARLPSMTAGVHALAMTAVNAAGVRSDRSSTIQVAVLGVTTTAGAVIASPPGGNLASVEPLLSVHPLVEGLREPTDLAVTPEGTVLIAERAGTVRAVASGRFAVLPALALEDVSVENGGLLAIALDPAFERSRLVFVLYTTADGYRVARYREVGGILGERVVLLDGVAAPPRASGTLRFGPDAKLYVVLDSDDDILAGDLGSYNGKVLRLNGDGSVPVDQAGLTPVFVSDIVGARAIDWAPADGALWIASGWRDDGGFLNIVSAVQEGRRGRIAVRYGLPEGQLPSAALFYRGEGMREWQGDLLLALSGKAQLLRLRLDAKAPDRVASTEIALDESAGHIWALGIGPGGVLYAASDDRLFILSSTGTDISPR